MVHPRQVSLPPELHHQARRDKRTDRGDSPMKPGRDKNSVKKSNITENFVSPKGRIMKKITGLFSILLLLLLAATVSAATSTSTSDSTSSASTDAAGLVTVSSVTMDPYVFYPFEEGTITVTLTNSGTSSVGLSDPDILSENVHVMNKNSLEHHEFHRTGIQPLLLVSGKGRSPGRDLFPAVYRGSTKCREYPLSLHDQSRFN